MKYTLTKKETGNKAARFHYTVTDEQGNVISERNSNREYVACTADGTFYFGRYDLIGKGEHGRAIKFAQGWGRDSKDNFVPGIRDVNEKRLEQLQSIAYLKTPQL